MTLLRIFSSFGEILAQYENFLVKYIKYFVRISNGHLLTFIDILVPFNLADERYAYKS